ncbi:hypothetical protein [Nocardia nepalensis]|uniref:hypothetical protein n=1 Tax=Nocardia nepalensis TaxID=3375448 RepID=UPI003B68095B
MNDILVAVGKRLGERWMTMIALPGLAYVGISVWAILCAQRHALDPAFLAARTRALTHDGRDLATLVLSAILALGIATLVGSIAVMVAEKVVHRWWIREASTAARTRLQTEARARWQARTPMPPTRYLPTRATAIGEAFRLLGERADVEYGLSLVHAWPRLWLLIDADSRKVLTEAHRRYFADAALVSWGMLYLPWVIWWWPAGIIAVTCITTGRWRARDSSRGLAALFESALDIHQAKLAAALGVSLPEGRITVPLGNQINDILSKRM